jgi:hypothetical protein
VDGGLLLVLAILAVVVAVGAAVRSIWSPCGLSMLSTITPMAEAGRGHRFRSTAAWFVLGSVVGGATLGGLMALAAFAAQSLGVTVGVGLGVTAMAALITAASDGRVGGFHLPGHIRQVNERWLDRYRSWVYGAGFGWQIGVGLATYIMTAGVYLLILMGGLIADPVIALAVGTIFGLVRGLAVYLSAGLDSPSALLAFHARFEQWREPVRRGMIVAQIVVGIAAAVAATSGTVLMLSATFAAVGILVASLRGPREAAYLSGIGVPGAAA